MNITLSYPRFRSTSRLALWVRRRPGTASRLPPESERCFFKTKESPERVSDNLLKYAGIVGELDPDLEALFRGSDSYSYSIHLVKRGVEPRESVLERLTEAELVRLCSFRGKRRLPERFERRIQTPGVAQSYVVAVGESTPYMEDLILLDPDSCMRHIKFLLDAGVQPEERFLRAMAGQDRHFLELSSRLGGRIPDYLLETVTNPDVALAYAVRFLRGRLPPGVEEVFMNSPRHAVRYAFDVVRGFSCPRLPDFLHAAVIMSANMAESDVKRYVAEVTRTSEKPAGEGD